MTTNQKSDSTVVAAVIGAVALLASTLMILLWKQDLSVPQEVVQDFRKIAIEAIDSKDEVLTHLRRSIERAEKEAATGNSDAKAAVTEANQGDFTKLQALLMRDADQKHPVQLSDDEIGLYTEISVIAFHRGDYDEALFRVNRILHDKPDHRPALNIKGFVLEVRGDFKAAQQCFETVLELSKDDERWRAIALGNLGLIAQELHGSARAEKLYQEALEVNRRLRNRHGIASNLGNLGGLYRERGDLGHAEQAFREAMQIAKELDDRRLIATQHANFASIYASREQTDKAEESLKNALTIFESIGAKEELATVYLNLATIQSTRGELNGARVLRQQALKVFEGIGHKVGIERALGELRRGEAPRSITIKITD